MNLHSLPKLKDTTKKRLGRGIGSGRGKTGGRGMKGQKARGKIPAAFVGGGLIYYKKLPYVRGWGNRKVSDKPVIVKLNDLNVLKANSTVNIASLIEAGVITEKQVRAQSVKILALGELKVALNVELPVSQSVKKQIELVGGKVV